MMIQKQYETIEKKILGYESIVKFYERNSGGRFQTKSNLRKIVDEIGAELNKNQTEKNLERLYNIQDRISKFI